MAKSMRVRFNPMARQLNRGTASASKGKIRQLNRGTASASKGKRSTLGFEDNRQVAVQHLKLVKGLANSPQAMAQKQRISHTFNRPVQKSENKTGLPTPLRAGLESLSGVDISEVRVHRNSDKPSGLNAAAYTQGNDIHLAPGQEQHLPHEAWHAVQQSQGRVNPTTQAAGIPVNDNPGLEKEADIMGTKALQAKQVANSSSVFQNRVSHPAIQRKPGRIARKVAGWAAKIPGYTLLTQIIGKNPITSEAVKSSSGSIIKKLVSIIPGGKTAYERLVESGTLGKAYGWVKTSLIECGITWDGVKTSFSETWDKLSIWSPKKSYRAVVSFVSGWFSKIKRFGKGVFKKGLEIALAGFLGQQGGKGEMVLGILKKAGKSFMKIIKNPGTFLKYLAGAFGAGFSLFIANIRLHMNKGLTGWLLGSLKGTGITLPDKLDAQGLFGLAMQALGLSYEKSIRPKLVTALGDKWVGRIEKSWEFIKLIAKGKFGVIYEKAKDKVSSLYGTVMESVKAWVTKKIIQSGIAQMLKMIVPGGAIITVVQKIYAFITFLMDKASLVGGVVMKLFGAIGKIAGGLVSIAGKMIEKVLGLAVPIVISLCAALLGLGKLGSAVTGLIKKGAVIVDKGITSVIQWVIKKAKGLFGKKKEGKDSEISKKRGKNGWWQKQRQWFQKKRKLKKTKKGEVHTLFFVEGDKKFTPWMSSDKTKVTEQLNKWKKGNRCQGEINSIQEVIDGINKALTDLKTAKKKKARDPILVQLEVHKKSWITTVPGQMVFLWDTFEGRTCARQQGEFVVANLSALVESKKPLFDGWKVYGKRIEDIKNLAANLKKAISKDKEDNKDVAAMCEAFVGDKPVLNVAFNATDKHEENAIKQVKSILKIKAKKRKRTDRAPQEEKTNDGMSFLKENVGTAKIGEDKLPVNVINSRGYYHAEMELVDKGGLPPNTYIAISYAGQNACTLCAAALFADGRYKFNGAHDEIGGRSPWRIPNFIKNDAGKREKFLGKTVEKNLEDLNKNPWPKNSPGDSNKISSRDSFYDYLSGNWGPLKVAGRYTKASSQE